MNPVQLWAATYPQQNYRIHSDNYLKLQRNPLKQVPLSLNLWPQKKKTLVDSFFAVFFATYTFSFLSLLPYNIALHQKNCTSVQKPSYTRARNCILEASSLMSVLNKLPSFRTPKHQKRCNWRHCIEIKVRILLSKCRYFLTLWKRVIETLLIFDFFLLALRSWARSRDV